MEFMTLLNAIATFLTIETGVLSNRHEAADAVSAKKMARLSCRVNFEKVSKDMEPYYSSLDDYISKYAYRMKEIIISPQERTEFVEKYYKAHPGHRMQKSLIDSVLNGFLDNIETILKEQLTIGEIISYRSMVEILKTHHEITGIALETAENTRQIGTTTQENLGISRDNNRLLIRIEEKLSIPKADSAIGTPDTVTAPDILDFLMVRQLTEGLFVNWKTGCLAGDFRSALDGKRNVQPALSPPQLRLLSILVQGEGAVVSWRDIFRRGKLFTKWQEKYARTEPKADDRENTSFRIIQREPTQEEIKEISICSIIELQNRIREVVGSFEAADAEAAKEMIQEADTKKGYRIKLFQDKTKIREKEVDSHRSLFSGYEGCKGYTEYDDFTLLTNEMESGRERCREVSAWLRRYYDKACRFFENRVSNKGEEDADSSEKEIFGDYTMVQAYMIPYVMIGEDRRNAEGLRQKEEKTLPDFVSAKDRYETGFETMLDYVERWHSEEGDPGRVLVLHGQPGDGKTTFCRKAVYAHCREGWLADTPHVFRFSLNPADNEIIEKNGIHFENAFSINDEEGRRFLLSLRDLKNMPKGNRRENMLQGSLIILDGYDELAGSMRSGAVSIEFDAFYRKTASFAKSQKCNVIITSRTMCIETDLKGQNFRDCLKSPVAAFAPLSREQQDAMIDRMIELDAPTEDRDRPEVCGTGCSREKAEPNVAGHKNLGTQKENVISLEDYRKEVLHPLRESTDRKLDDFKKLMEVPILFRIIIQKRFNRFKEADTVAELYGCLFSDLLSHKKYDEMTNLSDRMIHFYEEIAMGIFNYDRGTCPIPKENNEGDGENKNVGDIIDNRKLVYYFYTKRGENGGEHLGFLHNSFYQYFLARHIISRVREFGIKMLKEKDLVEGMYGPSLYRPLPKDFVRLFASLRADKLADPDLWKLVTQLAVIEQFKENHLPGNKYLIGHTWEKRIQPTHVECILKCLNQNSLYSDLMLAEDSYERKVDNRNQDGNWMYRRYREMENAVFNLLSSCAAIENGCIEGAERNKSDSLSVYKKERGRIAYGGKDGYPNVCELLRRGDYSKIYLSGINLGDCHLENAMLAGSYLSGVNLDGAHLDGADLSRAMLSGAKLNGAELVGTSLKGAILTDAQLESAKMKGANLHGAILSGARMNSAHMEGADLKGVDLKGAVLESAHMEEADLEGADLRGKVHLENAFLYGANLKQSTIEAAYLKGVDLRKSFLKKTCLARSQLIEANMERANIEGACLEKTDLRGADFSDAYMKEAYVAGAKLDEKACKSMKGADLRGVVFDGRQKRKMMSSGVYDLKTRTESGSIQVLPKSTRAKLMLPTGEKDIFSINDLDKGDRIQFGRYPQDKKSENGGYILEPMLWRILYVDKEKNRVLMITEKLIDGMPYHERREPITWERCTLRKWMNGVFIYTAFTPEEESLIAKVWNENHDNLEGWWGKNVFGGNATHDRVFTLSIDEARGFLSNLKKNIDRKAVTTCYARERGSGTYTGDGKGWWWLRSPGRNSYIAAVVYDGGIIGDGSRVDNRSGSVRPVLWLNL